MQQGSDEGDGLLSRSEMEVELARLVLAVRRRHDASSGSDGPDAEFITWFETASLELVNRVNPDLRPFVLARVQQIAESNAGLRISELEVDHTTLSFAAADEAPSNLLHGGGRASADASGLIDR